MIESSISVSISRKVNLGDYESADVFVCLTLPIGAGQAEIDAGLETGALAYKSIAQAVNEKAQALKLSPTRAAATPQPHVTPHQGYEGGDSAHEGNYSPLTDGPRANPQDVVGGWRPEKDIYRKGLLEPPTEPQKNAVSKIAGRTGLNIQIVVQAILRVMESDPSKWFTKTGYGLFMDFTNQATPEQINAVRSA